MTVNTDELGTRRSPSSSVLVVVIIMNIQQLRYFCSVMRIGTFSGAARAEGVSVQAVSKALGALEEELGLPLFPEEEQRRDGHAVWSGVRRVRARSPCCIRRGRRVREGAAWAHEKR